MALDTASIFGATQIAIGTSGLGELVDFSRRGICGGYFKIHSGAGTLAIVSQGQSMAQGYAVGATEIVPFENGAQFYLAATTATMTISAVFGLSAGYSLYP